MRNHEENNDLNYELENSNIYENVVKQFMIPHFNKVEFQHGESTKILRLRQKNDECVVSLWDTRIVPDNLSAITKFSDSSIFEEVLPSKRQEMFFRKISIYRGPQDGTILVPAVREDFRGRELPGLGKGRGRGRQIFNFHMTPNDEDVRV